MSEPCKDIDGALAALRTAIIQQNKRIAALEKQLQEANSSGNNSTNNKNSSLEARVAAIERYINTFDKACKDVTQSLKLIREVFKI